jgi:hypothetical protein
VRLSFALAPLLAVATNAASAQTHPCAKDAIARAAPLLALHFEAKPDEKAGTIDDKVKVLPPIKALKGNGRLDVLEVWGGIYKTDYRMRFIYVQGKGACALVGQEILEASNP